MSNNVNVLNIDIDCITLNDLLANLHEGVVFTPNVDHLVRLQKDKAFYEAYQQADYKICDSRIVKAVVSAMLGKQIYDVIPGSDFLPNFYNYHKENKNIKIFLLGAAPGVAVKAMNSINAKVGREIVVAAHSPSFGFEKDETECRDIVELINKTDANVLVIGVGAPKQEKWLIEYKNHLPDIKIFMALGATIDFEAGNIKRSPAIFQKLHAEWAYRLLSEPRRLWKRYLVEDMAFFRYIFLQKIKSYKNPFV